MRLYNTDHGPAREDEPGVLTVVDLPDLGDVVRDGGLDRIESAPCVDKVPLAEARLLAPVRRPGKVIIVGLNYGSHAQEALARFAAMGMRDIQLPTVPNFFIAAASAVTGPGSPRSGRVKAGSLIGTHRLGERRRSLSGSCRRRQLRRRTAQSCRINENSSGIASRSDSQIRRMWVRSHCSTRFNGDSAWWRP
jgi:hypothetical protein